MTPTDGTFARLERAVLRPVDGAWLAALRIALGLVLAISMERFLAYGWVDSLLVEPRFRFHYWGFGWVEPLSRDAMIVLVRALVGLAVAMAAGIGFRIVAPLFALGLTYIQLVDVSTYLNHYYLAGLLSWLLALSPASRVWSVDAWIRRRRGHAARETVAAAWIYLFRFQVGAVYVFAGLAKLGSDWLLHGQPLGIWLGARTDLPVIGRLFVIDGVPLAMSWAGFLFDTTIAFWLSWKKSRPWAYALVLVFHLMTRVLFDIGMFPIIMSVAALAFFSPGWPRRFIRGAVRVVPAAPSVGAPWPRIALGLGVVYAALQIALPLRCHLYGGNVLWHEQGMRFSWRVMVRAKGGSTTFLVRQSATGRVFHVSPREYLTPFQENEMASQPDLVLQLAHHVAEDFSARGHGAVEVRAESKVSLDGRPGALLVDPAVDLAKVNDSLAAASWILAAPDTEPPRTRPVL